MKRGDLFLKRVAGGLVVLVFGIIIGSRHWDYLDVALRGCGMLALALTFIVALSPMFEAHMRKPKLNPADKKSAGDIAGRLRAIAARLRMISQRNFRTFDGMGGQLNSFADDLESLAQQVEHDEQPGPMPVFASRPNDSSGGPSA